MMTSFMTLKKLEASAILDLPYRIILMYSSLLKTRGNKLEICTSKIRQANLDAPTRLSVADGGPARLLLRWIKSIKSARSPSLNEWVYSFSRSDCLFSLKVFSVSRWSWLTFLSDMAASLGKNMKTKVIIRKVRERKMHTLTLICRPKK